MRTTISLLAFVAVLAAPVITQTATARATTVAATQIPDGTYTATVEKVLDNKRLVLKLDNGMEATLTTNRSNVDFSKVQPNEQIKLSIINGLVAVYAPLSH